MNTKKVAIISAGILVTIYLLFLILPLGLSFILNAQSAQISKMVEDASGLKVKLEKMRIVTTPKLTAGFKIKHAQISLPNGDTFLKADNFQLKVALIPILARKIRIDMISAENINATLKVQPDGKFLIESALVPPPQSAATVEKQPGAPQPLPFGFKLSNHLPDMRVKNYNISFIDMTNNDTYTISGERMLFREFSFGL